MALMPFKVFRLLGCFTDNLCEFDVTAERIRKLHLTRTSAFWLQEKWVSNNDHHHLCPRSRHIEPIQAIEELHSTRRIFW